MTTLETRLSKLEATQPAVKGYKTFVVDDSADGDGLRRDASGTVITDEAIEALQADGYHVIEIHYVDEILNNERTAENE